MPRHVRPKVLVPKRLFPEAIEYLRERVELDYNGTDKNLSAAELLERLQDKDGIVSMLTNRFTPEVMDTLPVLKVISNVAVGFDNINIPAATERKIIVTNTPDVLTETTADFAFALMMATARRVPEGERVLRAGKWDKWGIDLFCGQDIHHATLGILGLGRIGKALSRRAQGFQMRVQYYDPLRATAAVEQELNVDFVDFDELFRTSDFVSVHVPLLPETRRLVGAEQFKLMKETAVFVNTSRGRSLTKQRSPRLWRKVRLPPRASMSTNASPLLSQGCCRWKTRFSRPISRVRRSTPGGPCACSPPKTSSPR